MSSPFLLKIIITKEVRINLKNPDPYFKNYSITV